MRKLLIPLSAIAFAAIGIASPALAAGSPAPAQKLESAGSVQQLRPVYASEVGPLAFSDCPSGYSCYWMNNNGTGVRWDAPSCTGGGTYWRLGGALNNNIESVRNRGGGTVHLYDADNGTIGYMRSIVNNGANINLDSNHDNKASSIRIDC